MRMLAASSMFLMLASAFLLYGLNYETRRLEAGVQAQERSADAMRSDIAVLKAERAHLARPERIEGIARGLGLAAPLPRQFAETPQEAAAAPRPASARQ